MKHKVQVFTVPRSGSTRVRGMLSSLLVAEVPPQAVSIQSVDCTKLIVCYRDFRDCAASLWRVERGCFSEDADMRIATADEAREWANKILTFASRLETLRLGDDAMLIRYEDHRNDLQLVLAIARFMGIRLSVYGAIPIANAWALKRVKAEADKRCGWADWDEKHQIHGHHVYKGEVGTWRRLFPEESHADVTQILSKPLKRWGYI